MDIFVDKVYRMKILSNKEYNELKSQNLRIKEMKFLFDSNVLKILVGILETLDIKSIEIDKYYLLTNKKIATSTNLLTNKIKIEILGGDN